MIKLKVWEKSLSFASAKKLKTVHKEQNLEDKIALLEKELEQPSASELQKTNIKEQLEICGAPKGLFQGVKLNGTMKVRRIQNTLSILKKDTLNLVQ